MSNDMKTTLSKLWNGEFPLWQTFWLFYFVGGAILKFIAASFYGNIGVLFGLAALLWAGFMSVPIWRAADKYEGNALYAVVAKVIAVLVAISFLLTIF